MAEHGLTDEQVEILRKILSVYAGQIERVGLFGSRATGKYKPASDIDMVLYGTLGQADIDRLSTLFAESPLPVEVDVVAYDLVAYPPFKAHIDAVMRPLFEKRDLV